VAPVGASLDSDMTVFSFHPVKTIASGEGGAVLTQRPDLAERLALFRACIQREPSAFVDTEAGFDHAKSIRGITRWSSSASITGLSDVNCALGPEPAEEARPFCGDPLRSGRPLRCELRRWRRWCARLRARLGAIRPGIFTAC